MSEGKRAPGAELLNYAAQVAAGKTGAKTNREKRINCCGDFVQLMDSWGNNETKFKHVSRAHTPGPQQ